MEITVVRCMYHTEKRKVRSLRETMGRGTPPWSNTLERPPVLLGAEALVGYIVTSGRAAVIQNAEEGQSLYPARWMEWERSAAGHPITRGAAIACALPICMSSIGQRIFRSTSCLPMTGKSKPSRHFASAPLKYSFRRPETACQWILCGPNNWPGNR